jgi:hypothetical protein
MSPTDVITLRWRRVVESESRSFELSSRHVEGPSRRRTRRIRVRVRFIKTIDMEATTRHIGEKGVAVDGSTAAEYASEKFLKRPDAP